MKKNGDFESGDMVVATVGGVPCSGTVHEPEFYMGKIVAYKVQLSVDRDGPATSVPVADVRAYLPGHGFQS